MAIVQSPVYLYVDASCYGDAGMTAPFICEINGEEVGRRSVTFKANETLRFPLALSFSTPGETVVSVRTERSRLSIHDRSR